jgi:hypothetical protein
MYSKRDMHEDAHQYFIEAKTCYLLRGQHDEAREAATKARHIESGNNFSVGSREKRRQERYSLRLPAIVVSEERQWREQTETLDVSKSGIRFSLARPVDWCSVLRVQLPLPSELRLRYEDRGTFSAHAMVCRCEESHGMHMIAAEFGMAHELLSE